MRRLPLAAFVAALAAAFLSAPALAEQGASNSQIVGGGSYITLDDAAKVLPSVDACPNLHGIQDTVPAHMTLDPHGNCIHEPSHEPNPEPIHHDIVLR